MLAEIILLRIFSFKNCGLGNWAPEAGGTFWQVAGGTGVGGGIPPLFKKLSENPLGNPVGYLVREQRGRERAYIIFCPGSG